MSDTWGVPGPTFLAGYLIALAVLTGYTAYRWRRRRAAAARYLRAAPTEVASPAVTPPAEPAAAAVDIRPAGRLAQVVARPAATGPRGAAGGGVDARW